MNDNTRKKNFFFFFLSRNEKTNENLSQTKEHRFLFSFLLFS